MKLILYYVILISLLCTGCKSDTTNPVKGTWELISADWIFGDTVKFPQSEFDREIKIIDDKYYLYIRQDTTNPDLFFSGGGTYTYQNNKFTEVTDFTSWGKGIGHASSYTCKFEGDIWIMTGPVNKEGDIIPGWQLYEKWKRIE